MQLAEGDILQRKDAAHTKGWPKHILLISLDSDLDFIMEMMDLETGMLHSIHQDTVKNVYRAVEGG